MIGLEYIKPVAPATFLLGRNFHEMVANVLSYPAARLDCMQNNANEQIDSNFVRPIAANKIIMQYGNTK